MRDDYFNEALLVVKDPYVLVSMVVQRIEMLRRGSRSLIELKAVSSLEEIALREIIEGRVVYVLGDIVVLDDIIGMGDSAAGRHTNENWSGASASPFVTASSGV
jgi:DNA-directed RNA polymerase subunit omega